MLRNLLAIMAAWGSLAAPLVPASAQSEPREHIAKGRYSPVALTCPADNAGTLELVSKNINGGYQNLQVHYRDLEGQSETAVGIDIYTSRDPGDQPEELNINLLEENTEADKVTSGKALRLADKIMERICHGSEESKQKFRRWLQENQAQIPH